MDTMAAKPRLESTPFERLNALWRYRKVVATTFVLVVGAAAIYTVLSPKRYESTATVLAPKEERSGLLGGLVASSLLPPTPGLSLGSVPSLTQNRDMLVSILKSRTVADLLVKQFGLQQRYASRYYEDAVERLKRVTDITISREGVISVKVEDRDANLAADVANAYVSHLDRLVARYGTGEAGRQRGFLTEQVARARVELEAAEEALRRFQERNRAISLQEQTRGAIETAARVKGEILAAEVQLQAMRSFATETHPDVVALRRRIDEMKRQVSEIQYGDSVMTSRRDFAVPFPKVPELGLELARLTRDVKVQETVVTLLTQQFEQAKIAEAKDIPVVNILDQAVPAERPSKPRVLLNLAVAGAVGTALAAMLAFLLDYIARLRDHLDMRNQTPAGRP